MAAGDIDQIAEPGLGELFAQLRADAEELARAELELVKARAFDRLAQYKTAVILFAVAGTFALAALIALLIGLILTLAPLTGPGGATAIVIGAVLLIVVVLGLVGRAKLSPQAAK